ncbi:glycosyltransferase [Muricauda brasiliensis]|uniref:glycosyltransferase n=1 Tax=Muricauda brasiliensis TaxID=2162892 RepID=UPI00131EFE78|nr:glycosyltransferase [Muricauda brasiliensis]
MRIVYFAQIAIHKNNGVLNKINNQIEAWMSLGHDVQLVILTSDTGVNFKSTAFSNLYENGRVNVFTIKSRGSIPIDIIKDWANFDSSFKQAKKLMDAYNPDIVYARYGFYQPLYRRIGARFKLIVEINTNFHSEYYLLRTKNIKRYFKYLYFRATNPLFLRGISGVAAVTNEIAKEYKGLPTKVFPNSLKVSNYKAERPTNPSNSYSLVFLGTPGMSWHGIDTLLNLAEILSYVRFNIIGYDENDLREVPKNVFLHGFLEKKDYLKIVLNSTAAIGTLALHRKGMKEACPLKVREYMACCKPLILPYDETAFELYGYPEWTLVVDFQKDSIEKVAEQVNTFLGRCHTFSITQEEVLKYIDVSVIEQKRLDFFKEVIRIKL